MVNNSVNKMTREVKNCELNEIRKRSGNDWKMEWKKALINSENLKNTLWLTKEYHVVLKMDIL